MFLRYHLYLDRRSESLESAVSVYPSKYYMRTESEITEGFKELTIEVDTKDVYTGSSVTEGGFETPILPETNIDELEPAKNNNNDKKILILKSGETITSRSTSDATHVDYLITVRFYNLGTKQDELMSKKFNGVVSIANIKC